MSYSIFIGELKKEPTEKSAVVELECEDAPVFGFEDISGKRNGRFPGYSQMAAFCKETGLYDLFFANKIGLLTEHPGYKPLTKEHLTTIIQAKEKWEVEHPGCKELLPTKDKEDPSKEPWEQEERGKNSNAKVN